MVYIQTEINEATIGLNVIQKIHGNLLWKNIEKITEIFQNKKEKNIEKYKLIECINV